jgi:hypothetical protein
MSTELQGTIIAVMADADCYLRLSHGYAAQPEKGTSLKPSDPRTDALINASGSDPAAVTAEASFFTTQLPVL